MKQPEYVSIPYGIFTDPELSHAAKMTYGRMRLYAGRDGQCYPTHETLAREVCLKPRQLRSVLKELHSAGLIDWRRTRKGCAYEVFRDRQKTAAPESSPDRQETATLETDEIGRKLPISEGEIGGKLPLSNPDRQKTADLNAPEWQKTADLDRQKTADRKAVSLKAATAAAAADAKTLRATLAKNGIPVRDVPGVESELAQMIEIANSLGAAAQLTDFIGFKAQQKKQQRDPIGSTRLALICVQQDFEGWLRTGGASNGSKPMASWTPPPPPTEEELRRDRPELWAEVDAERAAEKKAS